MFLTPQRIWVLYMPGLMCSFSFVPSCSSAPSWKKTFSLNHRQLDQTRTRATHFLQLLLAREELRTTLWYSTSQRYPSYHSQCHSHKCILPGAYLYTHLDAWTAAYTFKFCQSDLVKLTFILGGPFTFTSDLQLPGVRVEIWTLSKAVSIAIFIHLSKWWLSVVAIHLPSTLTAYLRTFNKKSNRTSSICLYTRALGLNFRSCPM